jgi:hypothetical protein
MNGGKPAFLITMDTEGDNLWSKPASPTTENSKFLPRFQALCERHGLKPTWLTNWEMANCPVFCEFGRDVQRRGAGEIGMHLHGWDTPPLVPLTSNDSKYHPYLFEFPEELMREKIRNMTGLLEERFETKMVSHRAGRWGFTTRYAQLLAEFGYRIDCSVTPNVSWASVGGDPKRSGGCDFTHYPSVPYFMDLDDIRREGDSKLLQAPMSVVRKYGFAQPIEDYVPLVRRYVGRVFPAVVWMRPTGRNLRFLLEMLGQARQERWPYVEFMLHSSELMPGGSPTFQNAASIEKLYEDLEVLMEAAGTHFQGATLSEFHDAWIAQGGAKGDASRREPILEEAASTVAAK